MALAQWGCDDRELNEAFVVGQELVVAGGHATELLPLADEPLSQVALPETPCCRRGRLAVGPGRHDGLGPYVAYGVAQRVGVVSLVGDHGIRLEAVNQFVAARDIVALARVGKGLEPCDAEPADAGGARRLGRGVRTNQDYGRGASPGCPARAPQLIPLRAITHIIALGRAREQLRQALSRGRDRRNPRPAQLPDRESALDHHRKCPGSPYDGRSRACTGPCTGPRAGPATPGGAPVRRPPTGRDYQRHRGRGTARAGIPPPFAACCCKRSALARAGGPRCRADPAGAKHPARARPRPAHVVQPTLRRCWPRHPRAALRTLLARVCLRSAAARLAAVRARAASWRDRSASAATRRMRPSMVSSVPRTTGARIRPPRWRALRSRSSQHAPSQLPLTANQETFLAIKVIYCELRIT